MKFYSFEDIRAAADCDDIAKSLYGVTIRAGRCAAAWRGGDNHEAVAIDRQKWYDHVRKEGGGAIELAAFHFNGDKQAAQEFLGERYGLAPRMQTGAQPARDSRYDALIRKGYSEVKRYGYHDADGNLVHFVSRLEHPTEPKEFCQGTPAGWGMGEVAPILYNLRGILDSPWCVIVEGEKKADLLISVGIPATTCAGGARKWHSGYAATFAGKAVAILPDNDEPGREHANIIAASLIAIASEVRIVATSPAPKGDVYDYLTDEGHTADDLLALIAAAPALASDAIGNITIPDAPSPELKTAKAANSTPFRNFIPLKVQPDPKQQGRRGPSRQPETERRPRLIQEMIDDCQKRFLGFPRKVGEELFDHDRDTQRIVYLYKSSELFAWIGRKSKQRTEWARGDAFVTKDEMLAGLTAAAIRYEAVSHVPDWPRRSDVYYAHHALPTACPRRSRFEALVAKFSPATPADMTFLRAFLIAPLWYIYGIPKPSWIIDSEDGAGTGKSTIAEVAAHLYCGEPIRTNRQELRMGIQELIKRLVSGHGRQQRILLIDNVTGQFSCPELADLITAQSISGRAPYGHGEETRPNNLVYTITANTATVDNDIADRSYYINVRRPPRDADWKPSVLRYVDKHRFEIIADIIGMLNVEDRFREAPRTRFPEFETQILQAVCSGPDEYAAAMEHLAACRTETNVEDEQAKAIEDALRERIAGLGLHPDRDTVWIRTPVVEFWLRGVIEESAYSRGNGGLAQLVRNLSKSRLLTAISPAIKRWPHHGDERRAGFMWGWREGSTVKTVAMKGERDVEVRL